MVDSLSVLIFIVCAHLLVDATPCSLNLVDWSTLRRCLIFLVISVKVFTHLCDSLVYALVARALSCCNLHWILSIFDFLLLNFLITRIYNHTPISFSYWKISSWWSAITHNKIHSHSAHNTLVKTRTKPIKFCHNLLKPLLEYFLRSFQRPKGRYIK